MPTETSISPKPRSEVLKPGMTRLARLTWGRKLFRRSVHWLSRFLIFLWARSSVTGLENIPNSEPALLVSNHLGDADLILGFAYTQQIVEPFAKIELYDIPLLGWDIRYLWGDLGAPRATGSQGIASGYGGHEARQNGGHCT